MILFDPDFFQNYSPYNIFFKLQGWTSIVVPIINVVFAVLGLVGALRYQSCLVFTVFLWFMFEMVSSVILGLWSGVGRLDGLRLRSTECEFILSIENTGVAIDY